MLLSRRTFITSTLLFMFAEWPKLVMGAAKPAMDHKLSTAIDRETGGDKVTESGLIILGAPDIAEDGSIVPLTIETGLPGVESIWVFVEKNPTPLAARFDLEKSLDAFVSLRIKMNESCKVFAIVKSESGYFSTSKQVNVVIGGCG